MSAEQSQSTSTLTVEAKDETSKEDSNVNWVKHQYHYFVGIIKDKTGNKLDFYFRFESDELRAMSAEAMLEELSHNDGDIDSSSNEKLGESFETMWLVMALKTRIEENLVACLFHSDKLRNRDEMIKLIEEELSDEQVEAATVMNGTDSDFTNY